ncbi:MAG TPA: SIMPL domain-containing protein [Sphingomicrobium sp.]|nr:SIMPL domain-containing protein [Sphingomicrobium sp.]
MKRLLIAAILAAASPAALNAQATQPQVTLGPNSAILSLSSEGESHRVPDIALFSAGVVTQATSASEALRENSGKMDRVIAALKRAGIADRDIQTSSINLSPRYSDPVREAAAAARAAGQPYYPPNDQSRRIIGYEARNTVQVRVRDLDKMGKVIDTLVSVGANEVNGPNFTLDEQEAALNEARSEAIAKGRARAELYARAAGMRVSRILSISEGGGYYPVQRTVAFSSGMPPPPPPPAPERDAPVAPGELTLGANVSMQFELVR